MEINTVERIKEGFSKGWLQHKKITYKVIPEKFDPNYTTLHAEHKGRFQFEHCSTWLKLPLSQKDRGLAKILNVEEQMFFEDVLNMPRQSLSFNKTGTNPVDTNTYNFWYGFRIEMKGEEELKLDLSDPMDALRDKLLSVCPEIAPDWNNRTGSEAYRWVRFDEGIEVKEKVNTSGLKMTAYFELEKIKENKLRMVEILKSLGKNYTYSTETDVLLIELTNIIERPESIKNQLNITDFLRALKDKHSQVRALITDSLAKQLIIKRKEKYFYNGDEIAKGMDELISWFNDPENQDTRMFIDNKLKNDTI